MYQWGSEARESAEFNKFFTDTAHFIPARGGESDGGTSGAYRRILQELCASEENKEKTILLSTHGAAMTAPGQPCQRESGDGRFLERGACRRTAR